jgi:hypothetical protein
MVPNAIRVATRVAIGTTNTNIQAKLNAINFKIIQVSSPFPISLSANLIINWRRNMNIKEMMEKMKGRKWFLSIYLYKIINSKYEKRKNLTRKQILIICLLY